MQIKYSGNNFAEESNRQVIDRGVPLAAFMPVGSDLLLDDAMERKTLDR